MKRLILISASLIMAYMASAQDATLYQFDASKSSKEVTKLGTAPEFPFLRNKTNAHQVYVAIKRNNNAKLNDLLMQEGYANGAQDLQESDITEAYVPTGTEGNMGSRGYTYGYYRLEGKPSEFRAWKIAANKNDNSYGALYLFAKCGNAFYPKSEAKTACVTVPVTITPDMQQINLNSSGTKTTTKDEVFVYYNRKHHRRHEAMTTIDGISVTDRYPSKPIMISKTKEMDVVPETYTVTMSSPDNTITACPDATLNVTANINVEKTSSYTGNYPDKDHKEYRKVSKHQYKAIARRMRRIERKENKIARRTGMKVDVSTARA